MVELCLIALSILLINGLNVIHPYVLFLVFYVYSFALGPLGMALRGRSYGYDSYVAILGSLLVFALGNFVGLRLFRHRESRKEIDRTFLKVPLRRSTVLYCLYALSVLLAAYYFISNRAALMADLNSARIETASGNGAIVYLMALPIVIMPMLLDLYLREDVRGKDAPSWGVLATLTFIACATLFVSGFRANVVFMLVCMLVLYCARRDIGSGRLFIYGFLLIILVAFLGMLRSGFDMSLLDTLVTGSYVNGLNVQYVFNTFPSKVGFQHGYTYLINILMLLPGPDHDFTLWLKDQIGISFSGGGVTPTIVGEFYINFGVPGIIAGMFLFGMVGPRIEAYFESSGQNFFSVFLVWEYAHCVSGGLANVMIPIILYGLVYKFVASTSPSTGLMSLRAKKTRPEGATS